MIAPPIPKPPFIKHGDNPFGVMSEEEFERLQRKAEAKRLEEEERSRRFSRRARPIYSSLADDEDEPEGLTPEQKLLWRSFVSADVNGDRKLSKRETMDALDRKALDSDRIRAILADYKDHDENANGFVEWEEFLALAERHPELADIMRDEDLWLR